MIVRTVLQVDIRTDLSTIYCRCYHLSTFGGGFAVAPNTIDFAFVFAHASFTENVTIYVMEIIVGIIYVLMFIWCRREDKIDMLKVCESIPAKLFAAVWYNNNNVNTVNVVHSIFILQFYQINSSSK